MQKIKLILLIIVFIFLTQKTLLANNNSQVDKISKNIRCLICQGQSVYDSQSDFALSLKLLISKLN